MHAADFRHPDGTVSGNAIGDTNVSFARGWKNLDRLFENLMILDRHEVCDELRAPLEPFGTMLL